MSNGAVSGINAVFQKNDISCLHIAAKNGNTEMVKLLLENGSNPNQRSKGNKLASDETDNEEVLLNRKYDFVDTKDNRRGTGKMEC